MSPKAFSNGKKCIELFQRVGGSSKGDSEIRAYYTNFLRDEMVFPQGGLKYFQNLFKPSNFQAKPVLKDLSDFKGLRVEKDSYALQDGVDAQRFSKLHFGKESADYVDWVQAHQRFVMGADSYSISLNTLQDIHSVVSRRQFYSGFERRRIREDFRLGKLTEKEALDSLMKVDAGVSYTGVDHSGFAGKLRKDPVDNFVYTGEPSVGEGISGSDFRGMSANPFFWLDPKSVKRLPNDEYEATFHYVPPKEVESITRLVIERAAIGLESATSDKQYIQTTAILMRDLATIHPFLDGNGRSIRLFGDMILAKRGLALPLRPMKEAGLSEYTDDVETIAREMANQMRQWKMQKGRSHSPSHKF